MLRPATEVCGTGIGSTTAHFAAGMTVAMLRSLSAPHAAAVRYVF